MDKRKFILLPTLSLLVFSCAAPIVSVLEHDNQRIKLSQVQRRKTKNIFPERDSTEGYSKNTKKVLRDKYTEYEKDDNGEEIMSVSLADVNIVAKSKNVPERAGKISLDFKVDVPASLINNKWQIQLTPFADKNGKIIEFDKIMISGAQFVKQQERGYQMYQNFISAIIPDSAYMQHLFDTKGYQKALFDIEEEFYYNWQKNLLSQSRFVDWRRIRNKRNMLFNGVMERNRSSIPPSNWKKNLPSFWMERNISEVPGQWKHYLSPDYNIEQKTITAEDSIKISKRFFDYKRMAENERRKALINDKRDEYIRFPKESCKLDTVIQNGDKFEYYYSQVIDADENIRKIDVTINGEVIAVDESRYKLPHSDTLSYFISSMVQFLDHAPRYKRDILLRHAQADVTALINYKSGSTHFDEQIGKNKEEVDKVLNALHKLTFTGELVLDSVNMVSTSSPEGKEQMNEQLSILRARELKRYLLGRTDDTEAIGLFQARAIGEDWGKLTQLIRNDENITNRYEILNAIGRIQDYDAKERVLKGFEEYAYIREEHYPKLRAVNFKFHLHRREMVKDTVYTTVIDTAYSNAVKLLENRQYKDALAILGEYNDHNTAVCLMSLGYDRPAIDILSSLEENENTLYLLAILYARENSFDDAIKAFHKSCQIDSGKWYRGQLDPEISKLINDYKLNFEQ